MYHRSASITTKYVQYLQGRAYCCLTLETPETHKTGHEEEKENSQHRNKIK